MGLFTLHIAMSLAHKNFLSNNLILKIVFWLSLYEIKNVNIRKVIVLLPICESSIFRKTRISLSIQSEDLKGTIGIYL